jgi:hypothetical protein
MSQLLQMCPDMRTNHDNDSSSFERLASTHLGRADLGLPGFDQIAVRLQIIEAPQLLPGCGHAEDADCGRPSCPHRNRADQCAAAKVLSSGLDADTQPKIPPWALIMARPIS